MSKDLSFEEYAAWARSRYPAFAQEDELTNAEASVYAPTAPPASSDACPVTVKSATNGAVVLTPVVRRSR